MAAYGTAPKGKKRRRELANVDTQLVEIYEDLANENVEIRLKAASTLVDRFSAENNPTEEELEKAVRRLFRGLCSSRKAARPGFAIALTELLSQAFGSDNETRFGVDKVINILESQTTAEGGASKQEKRDYSLGRLFGAEVTLKALFLVRNSSSFEYWNRIVNLICDLAVQKASLREQCCWVIFESVNDLARKSFDVKYAESTLDSLASRRLLRTPEGVAIWLAVKNKFPNARFPNGVWKNDDPLSSKERGPLALVLKEASTASERDREVQTARGRGVWSSNINFAWGEVLSRLYVADAHTVVAQKTSVKEKRTRTNFKDFWIEVIDHGMFAASSSEERKHWGFLLFAKVVSEAPEPLLSEIFTKNFMRCLMNQLAAKDRYLHRMAQKAVTAILRRAAQEPDFIPSAVYGLMGAEGSINFDKATNTKTVEKLLAAANAPTLEGIVQYFERLVTYPEVDDQKQAAGRRHAIAELLQSIITKSDASSQNTISPDADVCTRSVLAQLTKHAYGQSTYMPPITPATRLLFQNKILSCLNHLMKTSNGSDFAYLTVDIVRKMAREDKTVIEASEDVWRAIHQAWDSHKSIDKAYSKSITNSSLDAMRLLYSLTLLQVYNGDPDAVSMLDDLQLCSESVLAQTPKAKKKKASETQIGQGSEILIELLLSFASKPSKLYRTMTQQVLEAFTSSVTAEGLESLTAVLQAKDNLAGQEELFVKDQDEEHDDSSQGEGKGDASDSGENNDDSAEEASDVEIVDGTEDSDVEVDDADSVAEASDGEDEDETELAVFNAKLAAALGTHRSDEDLGASESSSDVDMDDSEMEALDPHIEAVFRARQENNQSDPKGKKQERKDAKETMLNFKFRVLDLLDIYVKKEFLNPLALELLLPLLQVARQTNERNLATRARSVLKEYCGKCKGKSLPELEQSTRLWGIFRAVHAEAGRSEANAHGAACSQASLLCLKVLVAKDDHAMEEALQVYAGTMANAIGAKDKAYHAAMFTDLNNWGVSASKRH